MKNKSFPARVYQPMVGKFLLVIQSSGASMGMDKNKKNKNKNKNNSINVPRPSPSAGVVKSPKWLQSACGSLLSERLMQKNGVMNVIRYGKWDILKKSFEKSTFSSQFWPILAIIEGREICFMNVIW